MRDQEELHQVSLPKILRTFKLIVVVIIIISGVIRTKTIGYFTKHFRCPSYLTVCFLELQLPENNTVLVHCCSLSLW